MDIYAPGQWEIVSLLGLFSQVERTEHRANERAKIDDLYAAMEIYRVAIQRLVVNIKVWKLGFQTFYLLKKKGGVNSFNFSKQSKAPWLSSQITKQTSSPQMVATIS